MLTDVLAFPGMLLTDVLTDMLAFHGMCMKYALLYLSAVIALNTVDNVTSSDSTSVAFYVL